jgi:hypothetical protein
VQMAARPPSQGTASQVVGSSAQLRKMHLFSPATSRHTRPSGQSESISHSLTGGGGRVPSRTPASPVGRTVSASAPPVFFLLLALSSQAPSRAAITSSRAAVSRLF